MGALPLGQTPLSIHFLELFCEHAILLPFSLSLTIGMPAFGLGVSQMLFSPGHWHRSTDVRFQDCSNHGPGPAEGTVGAVQTLTYPTPYMYVTTESTAVNIISVSVVGALTDCSDFLQVLTLPSQSWEFSQ